MSAANVLKVLRNPGRLVSNPTNCSTGQAFPYGGKELGRIRRVRFRMGTVVEAVVEENWGEITEEARVEKRPLLAFAMEQWDDDAFALAYDKVTTTGLDQGRIDLGASPGPVLPQNGILFAPFNENDKAVWFRRPIIREDDNSETDLVLEALALHLFVMRPTRDSLYATTPFGQIGMLGDLVL